MRVALAGPATGARRTRRGSEAAAPDVDSGATEPPDATRGADACERPETLRAPVAPGRSISTFCWAPRRPRMADLPADWDGFVAPQYAALRGAQPARRGPTVVSCREGEGDFVPLPPPGGATEIEVERQAPGRYRVRSHWQDGWLDVSSGKGEVTLTDRVFTRFRMSLENYLRVAGQLLAIERGCS